MSLLQKRAQSNKHFKLSTKFENNAVSQNWNSFLDLRKSSKYDKIVSMNIECCDSDVIPHIPPFLQILVIDLSMISSLDNLVLPKSLTLIKVNRSKLRAFPRIEHLIHLETVDFHDCYIEQLNLNFPDNLRTANFSFNKISQIDWSCLNPGLITLDISSNFLDYPPPDVFNLTIQCHHNNFDERIAIRRNLGMNVMTSKAKTNSDADKKDSAGFGVYDNSENVHFISIQQTAAESLKIIMKLCPRTKFNPDFIKEIKATYQLLGWCGRFPDSRYDVPPIEEWCADNTVFTEHAVTYRTLLERVWTYTKSKWRRHEIIEVMKQELDESIGLCMTGAFTRTVSILSGFVDGVHIGISDKERMQERISALIEKNRLKYKESDVFVKITRSEVADILDDTEIPDTEKEAWLDAIE